MAMVPTFICWKLWKNRNEGRFNNQTIGVKKNHSGCTSGEQNYIQIHYRYQIVNTFISEKNLKKRTSYKHKIKLDKFISSSQFVANPIKNPYGCNSGFMKNMGINKKELGKSHV